jgi:hypothetical protein
MKRLHASLHDFRKPGVVAHFSDGEAFFREQFGGTASRQGV